MTTVPGVPAQRYHGTEVQWHSGAALHGFSGPGAAHYDVIMGSLVQGTACGHGGRDGCSGPGAAHSDVIMGSLAQRTACGDGGRDGGSERDVWRRPPPATFG